MADPYPLEPLLTVRHFREENAKIAVNVAQRSVREAEAKVQERQKELEAYRNWLPEEENRRYDTILGKTLSLKTLDKFKAELALLKEKEFQYEEAVVAAQEEQKKCLQALKTAQEAAHKARMDTAKIVAHKDIWLVDYKKEQELAADKEMEDFKPMSMLGAEADE